MADLDPLYRRRQVYGPLLNRFALFLICSLGVAISVHAQNFACLPAGVDESSLVYVVSGKPVRDGKKLSVGQVLNTIRAKCSRGSLVDKAGKQIRIFVRQDCWGNPPADYLRIVEEQERELKRLRRKFTVLEIDCERGTSLDISVPPDKFSFRQIEKRHRLSILDRWLTTDYSQ